MPEFSDDTTIKDLHEALGAFLKEHPDRANDWVRLRVDFINYIDDGFDSFPEESTLDDCHLIGTLDSTSFTDTLVIQVKG